MRQKLLITAVIITLSSQANAGWFDSLFGGAEDTATSTAMESTATTQTSAMQTLDALAMIPLLTDSLGVSEQQAEGGLGSLFNFAKGTLTQESFGQLSSMLPGVDQLLGAVPAVSQTTSQESSSGLSGLLNTAAQYSDSLQAVNQVSQQFQALGLKPEMILQYMQVAQQYLNTPEGQQAKQLLMDGLSGLGG